MTHIKSAEFMIYFSGLMTDQNNKNKPTEHCKLFRFFFTTDQNNENEQGSYSHQIHNFIRFEQTDKTIVFTK